MTDALETGEAADCALLVVRQDAASRVSVINSLAALDSFGVPVLGYGYGYGYGRDRGYGYGQQKEKTGAD